jgi:YD repeat-containing protein
MPRREPPDALGGQTAFAYDGFDELTSKTDARTNTTDLSYDNSGNLARIADALGNNTVLGYDLIGRLTSYYRPERTRDRSNVRCARPRHANYRPTREPYSVCLRQGRQSPHDHRR